MNAYIKEIVLFSADGDKREVHLSDGLNIITGDSKAGKSALIEIVDYCLFSSRSTIPVGKITEFTDLFCIVLKVSNKYLVIARPHWKSADKSKAYFSFETNALFLDSFTKEHFDNKSLRQLKDVQTDVEQHLGLSIKDTRESLDIDRRHAGKATMRSFISLLFQHQNLIANKHSIFYRFEDYQKRKKTIEQMPLLLGWVDAEYYSLMQQLDAKKKLIKVEKKRQESIKFKKSEEIDRLRLPINQYYNALGFVLEENIPLGKLKSIAKDLPPIPSSIYENSDIKSQYFELNNKRTSYRTQLTEVNTLIKQIEYNGTDAYEYGTLLNQIVVSNSIEQNGNLECPVCNQLTTQVNTVIQEIQLSKKDLIEELQDVGSYKNDNTKHLTELLEQKDSLKKKIRKLTTEITNLQNVVDKAKGTEDIRDILIRLKGRIEVILEMILHKPTLADSSYDIEELTNEIKIIQDRLDGYNIDAKIDDANVFLSKRMTEISEQLDFEDELQPGQLRFDLKTFEFYYLYNKEKIRLYEMGSGANWLACHLSIFLSLLHLSCRENKSSIPSFLFIDQPSQVYFPKTTKIISITNGEIEEDDENIMQVKNIFKVIAKEIETIRKECRFAPQVVVMEHADEKEFDKYVKERWSNNGKKLV